MLVELSILRTKTLYIRTCVVRPTKKFVKVKMNFFESKTLGLLDPYVEVFVNVMIAYSP